MFSRPNQNLQSLSAVKFILDTVIQKVYDILNKKCIKSQLPEDIKGHIRKDFENIILLEKALNKASLFFQTTPKLLLKTDLYTSRIETDNLIQDKVLKKTVWKRRHDYPVRFWLKGI